MKKMWALCAFELKRLFGNRKNYVTMFVLPLVFTFLFGNVLGGGNDTKMKIFVVDEDQSVLSSSYYEQMKKNPLFDVTHASKEEATKALQNKKVEVTAVIPKGFQDEEKEITLQYIPEFVSRGTVTEALRSAVLTVKTEKKAAQTWSQYTNENWQGMYGNIARATTTPVTPKIETITKSNKQKRISNVSGRAAGFSIMFVMMVLMSATGTILEARKNGVWYRMMATPASRGQVLGGYLFFFFILGWIQFGILMITTHFIFNIVWGNVMGIFALVSALLLAAIGLALMLAGFVKTTEQQSSLGMMTVVATCMIAGVYWPIEVEPLFMQRIADFVPQTWAMRGFTELIARGGGIADIIGSVGVLLLFAVVFFTIGIKRVRYE